MTMTAPREMPELKTGIKQRQKMDRNRNTERALPARHSQDYTAGFATLEMMQKGKVKWLGHCVIYEEVS